MTLMDELFDDLGIKPDVYPPRSSEMLESAAKMTPASTLSATTQLSYFGKSMATGHFQGQGSDK